MYDALSKNNHFSTTTLSLRKGLGHGIVHVAVAPVLARLGGLDHFMTYIPVVLGGMLAYGRIAAAHVAADETLAQVHPLLADLQALLAPLGARLRLGYWHTFHVFTY